MAARRLVIVMVVVLALSTLLAGLAGLSQGPRTGTATTATGTTTATGETGAEGKPGAKRHAGPASPREGPTPIVRPDDGQRLHQSITVGAGKLFVVPITVGDLLELEVFADPPGEVAVAAQGRIEFADQFSPARFSILAERPARLAITLDGKRHVGEVRISDGSSRPPGRRPRAQRSRP